MDIALRHTIIDQLSIEIWQIKVCNRLNKKQKSNEYDGSAIWRKVLT